MKELSIVLDELVRDAPLQKASWSDVVARSGRSRRKPIFIALVAALLLGLTGTAVGLGVTFLGQQKEFHAANPHDPHRIGPLVEVTSGEDWALIAWRSDVGICLDFAIPGNSPFACGFPVRGAPPELHPSGAGPPTHAIASFYIGGGLAGGDDKSTLIGVTVPEVAKVVVELRDGGSVEAPLYDAPDELGVDLRFFIVRVWLPADTGGPSGSPILSYDAYDRDGNLIERFRE